MALSSSPLTYTGPASQLTLSCLSFVMSPINAGEIVALYTRTTFDIFHKRETIDLSKNRIVYADCTRTYDLPALVQRSIPGVTRLEEGDLRTRIIKEKDVVSPGQKFYYQF